MAKRTYCLVRCDWTIEHVRTAKFTCGRGYRDHHHLSFTEVYGRIPPEQFPTKMDRNYLGQDGALAHRLVEWLAFPRVLRMVRLVPAMIARDAILRAYLFSADGSQLRLRQPWARALLEEMGDPDHRLARTHPSYCQHPGCDFGADGTAALARPRTRLCTAHAFGRAIANRDFAVAFPGVELG